MTEETKSIWKKTWKGSQWLFAWLVLVAAVFLILITLSLLIPHPQNFKYWWEAVFFDFTSSLITATVCVGLWSFVCWGCQSRNFKRFLFACACLITLIALFYAEEDWRGKYGWESYQHEAEANGAKFDWDDVVPTPVPDDQNFAMSPVWIARIKYLWLNSLPKAEAWYGDRVNDEDVSKFLELMPIAPSALTGTNWAYRLPPAPDFPIRWTSARKFDLKPWQSYYRNLEETNPDAQISITPQPQSPAADVLLALSKFDPAIAQLRQDSQLPYSRFPVQYDTDQPFDILLPHLAALKQCAQVLQLRAIAELQCGQPDKALDDIKLMFRLTDSVRTEPFIITHLVRMVIMQMAIQAIYEGMSEHQWTDAQLAVLDSELSTLDFPADFQLSVRCDCIADIKNLKWLEQKRSRCWTLFNLIAQDNPNNTFKAFTPAAVAFYLAPKGWFYQADILLARQARYWKSVMTDDGPAIVSPAKVSETSRAIKTMSMRPRAYNFLGAILTFDLSSYARRTAFAQESADLTRVAIALERYHLALGGYPDSLDALAPRFMQEVPPDIINGQSLHYRLTSDGQFVLYSVGWNERDDGGIAFAGNPGGAGIEMDRGDWVWRYPRE